jgi:predicted DNA-binding transcriptional regulator AlpA
MKALPQLREALFDHPAVVALLGREPAPAKVDDDTGNLLDVVEVEGRTGLDRMTITEMIGRGAFPRAVAKDNRGNRLRRESAVERWQADLNSALV